METGAYSDIILDYYKNPVNFGKMKGANVSASGGNVSCGDTVDIFIKFDKTKIKDISFTGAGCAVSRAGICVLTEIVKGMEVDKVFDVTPEDIDKHLGGVVKTRTKCALLGLNVIKKALSEWKKSPTKKLVLKNINI